MLAGNVALASETRGLGYPLAEVAPHLRAADLAFGNLESPLSDLPARYPRNNVLRASPALAPVLREAGFGVLSLANNHAIDCQRPGLQRTRQALTDAVITPVGAGPTLAEAERGVVMTVKGLRIGFLAYSDFGCATFILDPTRESVVNLNEECLRRTIPELARRCDVVVVSYHWGVEGRREPSPRERRLAHLAVDLGAKLVVGHHAHVRGAIEKYRGGLIAYCLGNLVFDEHTTGGNEGYILTCNLDRSGVTGYATTPVRVVEYQGRVEE
jgi:poly-gamma-glutamate capsule biosynthesis protein CapA/YwtB (metallophosphatase superfamily)